MNPNDAEFVASDLPAPATVAIVDDEMEVAETISMMLERHGHKVVAFPDADSQILEKLRSVRPGLLILDLVLPSRNGLELLQELQKDEQMKSMPVIICSVIRQKRKIVEALDSGAVDFLTKPFEQEELEARVNSALLMNEIERRGRANEEYELLQSLAETVHREIRTPLQEMKKHLRYLEGTDFAAESEEGSELIAAVTEDLKHISEILGRYNPETRDPDQTKSDPSRSAL